MDHLDQCRQCNGSGDPTDPTDPPILSRLKVGSVLAVATDPSDPSDPLILSRLQGKGGRGTASPETLSNFNINIAYSMQPVGGTRWSAATS